MNLLEKVDYWSERHHPKWLDVLRILLGLILFGKGIYFISDTNRIVSMLHGTGIEWIAIIIAHYVAMAHLFGGLLITVGLITRVAILFQIPILAGAIIFVNIPRGMVSFNAELELSILVLFLLVFFLVEGSGPLSVDSYVSKHQE
ncbi:MAG: DoxX family protein [Ignavibacteria bacterium]